MKKLKFFIFLGHKVYLTLPYWTLATLEGPSFASKIHGSIWGLSSIENSPFTKTLDFIPKKYFPQSSA